MQVTPVQPYTRLATRERCANCGASGHSARNCPRNKVQPEGVQDSTKQGWVA